MRAVWDGAEAIEVARDWRPDLAFVDIGLPGMTGYEVARRIRQALDGEVTAVALTGDGNPETHERVFAAGFDRHLTRPADPGELGRLSAPHRPADPPR